MNPNDKVKTTDIIKKIYTIAEPLTKKFPGILLWDIEFAKDGKEWVLSVTLDKNSNTESVTMEDCVAFHKELDPALDKHDPIPGSYSLEISSPGLNRKLKTDEHIKRYISKNILLKLYSKIDCEVDGKTIQTKEIKGILVSFENDTFKIATENGTTAEFEKKSVANIYANDE